MGENFLRKQTERFRHGQDRSYAEFTQENLLTRVPEAMGHAIVCAVRSPGLLPTPNEQVTLSMDGSSFAVCRGNSVIGTVEPSESGVLGTLLGALPPGAEMLPALVSDTMPLTGEFQVRISLEPPTRSPDQ